MPDLRYIRVNSPLSGKGITGDELLIDTGGITSSLLADTGVTAAEYTNPTLTVNAKGQITDIEDGEPAGVPNSNEQLGKTGASIAVSGISASSSLVMHFRNGVLQTSAQYTVGPNSITPTAAGGGAYDDEDLITIWWD